MLPRYLLLSVMLLISCSHLKPTQKEPVQLDLNQIAEVSFKGKGTGAGIALMAVMGPVGIAIGSAIDVGISKEINQTLAQAQFNLTELAHSALNSKVLKHKRKPNLCWLSMTSVFVLYRVGVIP